MNRSSAGAISIDLAEVEHRDAVGDVAHHREVVRDEQIGEPEALLQVDQQVDDLRLDVHVERGDRLVGDDEFRLERERARNRDALALPAGKLVRVADRHLRIEPDRAEQLVHALARFRPQFWSRPWKRIGSLKMSPTVMRGLSEA